LGNNDSITQTPLDEHTELSDTTTTVLQDSAQGGANDSSLLTYPSDTAMIVTPADTINILDSLDTQINVENDTLDTLQIPDNQEF
jgi:hypothetical protein